MIEASILLHANTSYDNVTTQDLAKHWWETILLLTGGNLELVKQISELTFQLDAAHKAVSNHERLVSLV